MITIKMSDLISRMWLLDVVENIIEWDTERDKNRIIHQIRELTPTADKIYDVPDINVGNIESLTDEEQRIFLCAMGREEKFCKQLDNEWLSIFGHDGVNLLTVCKEIERKVKKVLW